MTKDFFAEGDTRRICPRLIVSIVYEHRGTCNPFILAGLFAGLRHVMCPIKILNIELSRLIQYNKVLVPVGVIAVCHCLRGISLLPHLLTPQTTRL